MVHSDLSETPSGACGTGGKQYKNNPTPEELTSIKVFKLLIMMVNSYRVQFVISYITPSFAGSTGGYVQNTPTE
jgi:hypothetical protein